MSNTIKRDQLIEACKVLGFDPDDVAELHVYRESVSAVLYVRDPKTGSVVRDPKTDSATTSRISRKVVE